jgi:G3E family GTPase
MVFTNNLVENESVEQVAFADVLVLNKTDLVTPEELDVIKAQLRVVNKTANDGDSIWTGPGRFSAWYPRVRS